MTGFDFKGKKFNISTYGCQMNENDSGLIAGMLLEAGSIETQILNDADIIIFNTCCVRENAELKIYGRIGALKKLKEERPDVIIAVGGCMVQQPGVADYIRKTYRFVNAVFGTYRLPYLINIIRSAYDENGTFVDISESEKDESYEACRMKSAAMSKKSVIKSYVTIMRGCNNFCSYCIVPFVRGRERSRPPAGILGEVKMLAERGCREVILLGQNVNSYGLDLKNGYYFRELLEDVDKINGILRIRFMTSHPKDLSHDIISAIRDSKKICRHVHLPLQSGSSEILRQMNRKYTRDDYLRLAGDIRDTIPGIALTTDIIVGYPGETDRAFEDTIDMIERIRFDTAYTFIYSPRKGTPAASDMGMPSEGIIKERFGRLKELQDRISEEINHDLQDSLQEVLTEGPSRTDPDKLTGRTGTNKIVNFEGDSDVIGKLTDVRIKKVKTWSLEGEAEDKLNI